MSLNAKKYNKMLSDYLSSIFNSVENYASENLSDQAIKRKFNAYYNSYTYKGPRVDIDMTPKRKENAILIPTEKKKYLLDYETMDSVNRLKKPILTNQKPKYNLK